MTVYFIGAGPGASDLITLRGLRLIQRCTLCLYAGSLVPRDLLSEAPKDARLIDSASLTLGEIVSCMADAHALGGDIARVHSGDPSLYGAVGEQMRYLDALGIPYELVPGVPAFAAAAAVLKRELTLPSLAQTVILTRTAMKASRMPAGEDLSCLARTGATLAIHLSVRNLRHVCAELIPYYGADCPIAILYRISWPDERILRGYLGDILDRMRSEKMTRTALILVGPVLTAESFPDSALYSPDHAHILRNRGKKKEKEKRTSPRPRTGMPVREV